MGAQKPGPTVGGRKRRMTFKFVAITDLHALRKKDIFEYVQRLHEMLRRANRKVGVYRERLRQMELLKTAKTEKRVANVTEVAVEKEPTESDVKPDVEAKPEVEFIGPVIEETTQAESEDPTDGPILDQNGIVDFIQDIKEACETAQIQSGFVYEPTSGLYYDYSSGYYYNAEQGLYYDGNTGYYYEFDAKLNKYIFHSQAYADPEDARTTISKIASSTADFVASDPIAESAASESRKAKFKKTNAAADSIAAARPSQSASMEYRSDERRCRRRRSRSSGASLSDDYEEEYHRSDSRRRYGRRDVSRHRSSKHRDRSPSRRERRRRSRSKSSDRSGRRRRRSGERKRSPAKLKKHRNSRSQSPSDLEDGELSSNSSASSTKSGGAVNDDAPLTAIPEVNKYEDVARKYPPSLRIVVLETNLPKLRVGELFIITYKGGSLGREGAHDVIVPDINVSKFHLTFKYNETLAAYECVDLGSRNGTLFKGRRMSNAKQESEPFLIVHGATITLSQTTLLLHVHEGHTTCAQCEPGLIIQPATEVAESSSGPQMSHKQELKQIKKRYGLADDKYVIQQSTTASNDRAAQRRAKVGSTNPNEKTEVASVDTNIAASNKGFQMLSKLGWAKGQKLGKNETGILEPIPLVSNVGHKGLGCEAPSTSSMPVRSTAATAKKTQQLRITQERYNRKDVPDDIFGEDGDIDG